MVWFDIFKEYIYLNLIYFTPKQILTYLKSSLDNHFDSILLVTTLNIHLLTPCSSHIPTASSTSKLVIGGWLATEALWARLETDCVVVLGFSQLLTLLLRADLAQVVRNHPGIIVFETTFKLPILDVFLVHKRSPRAALGCIFFPPTACWTYFGRASETICVDMTIISCLTLFATKDIA